MKEKSQIQIFLSYGREDATRVKELYQRLKGDGYQPRLDTEDILPGENYQGKLQDAIASSDLLIACFSQASTSSSTYINQELQQALVWFARSHPEIACVILLRLDQCKIPDLSIEELGINLWDNNALDYQHPDAYDRLLKLIKQISSVDASPRSQLFPQTYHNQIAFQNAQVGGNLTTGDIIQNTKVININESLRIEIDEQQVLNALNDHYQIILNSIRSTIGKELHLNRDQLVQQVLQQLGLKQVVLISGPAGSGKSVIAKDTLKLLSTEYLTFSFRAEVFAASHFDETLSNNQIPANGEQLSTVLASQNRKVLLVESIEKLLEKSTRDAFIDLLKLIEKDPNWQLVLTCRDYSVDLIRSAFLDFANVEHSIFQVPPLSNDELEQVKATYPSLIRPLSNSSLYELLRNPYFLDKALQISWSKDKPLPQSESELRTRFWKEIVRAEDRVAKGMPRKREEAFIKIALGRAQKLDLYVACPDLDSEVVESLRYDSLIVYSERNNDLMAVAHDVLEDWAILQWIDKQYATYQDSLAELSEQLGTHPAVRRGYRKWVAEQVERYPEMADTLFQDTICEKDLSAQFRDDTIISFLRSPASVAFLEKHREKLFANERELIRKIIHLLRVACVTIRDQINPSETSISLFNVPEGAAWCCVLQLVETHLDSFIQDDYCLLLGLIEDWSNGVSWQNPYPDGSESVATIAYWLLSRLNDYRFRNQWKQTLKIIAKIPSADTERFIALLQGEHDDQEQHRARGELLNMILTGSHEGISVARDMPKTLVSVARKYLLLPETDIQQRFYGSLDLEPLFGLRSDNSFFFASAYRGPFLMLLKFHPDQGLNFIIEVFNHSAEWYAHPRVPSEFVEPPYKITLTFSDGTSRIQWCNDRLWNLYRGTSVGPYVLQCLLMALEQWLLELAEVSPNDLDNTLIYILKQSDSVCLTAVVASVATAYPHRSGETLLVLLKSPECIQLDRYRLAKEVEAGIIFGFNPEDKFHRKEREKANCLPHRRHDLEVAILNLQFGEYALQVQEILDQYYAKMPPLEEQDDNDRLWRLRICRMDWRNYNVTEESFQETQDNIPIYPKIASDLKEMVDKHQSQSQVISAGISLLMWGQKIFQGEENDTVDPTQWQQRLQEAQEINLEKNTEETHISYSGSVGYVAAVCIRDHWDEMSKYEQNWCVEVVCLEIERQGDFWNQFDRIQKASMSGDRPCAEVLPLLLGKTLNQTYTSRVRKAFLTALTHAIEEVRHYVALGIGKYLWGIDRALTLRCVNTIAWEAVLIEQGINCEKDRPHNKRREFEEVRMEVANHLRQHFYEHNSIPDDAYQKMDIETLLGAEVNVRILRILGQAPNETIAIAAFERLAQTFVKWWDEDAQRRKSIEQKSRQRNYEIERELSNLLQNFLLHTSKAAAKRTIQPILDAVEYYPQEVHWILSGLIILEDSQPNTSQFWLLWDLFADRVRQAQWLATIDNGYTTGKDMISAIFLGKYWKDGVHHWKSLEGYPERIHNLFKDLPASSTILEKYLEFLYGIGSQSLPQAFIRIAEHLKHGNSQQMLSKTNNVFLLEMLLQRYVYGKPSQLKRKANLRDAVLVLLDLLVDNGSSAAFRMRDDFVTPASNTADKTM